MEYNPEFWMEDIATTQPRHRVMPAFGALLMADYFDFLSSGDVQTLFDDYISSGKVHTQRLQDIQFDRRIQEEHVDYLSSETITGELADAVNILHVLSGLAGYNAEWYGKQHPFLSRLEPAQQAWGMRTLFHAQANHHDTGIFDMQTRTSPFMAIDYFGLARAAQSIVVNKPLSAEALFRFMSAPVFAEGLRDAASAPMGYWQIIDHGERQKYMVDACGDISNYTYETFTATGAVTERHRRHMKEQKQATSKLRHDSSSGCPVRHTKLGPNVQAAFTEEQREWITSTVAEIDENGVMHYTWDPFRATTEIMIPTARTLLQQRQEVR